VLNRPLILDFGLHEGEDTEFYLACGARVIAFEANGDLVKQNTHHFNEDIQAGRLEIVTGAIVPPNFAGKYLTFYNDTYKSVWGTTSKQRADHNANLGSHVIAVTVRAIDLKAILSEIPQVLYAKIDIEGADHCVIETLGLTKSRPEFISIESDKLDLQTVVNEIETLEGLGYTRFAAVQQAIIPGSRIQGRTFEGGPLDYRFKKHASGPFGPYLKQDYKTAGQVIDDYRHIFRAYARYGDDSWFMRFAPARLATRAVNAALVKAVRRPLCGWYDTHAGR
jgi:FkbM family methyltransferase